MIKRVDNKIIGDSWDELEIDIPVSKQNSASDVKIKKCPECNRLGKKHLSDPSISVIPIQGYGKCHKCGTTFVVRKEEFKESKKEYTPPVITNLTSLGADGLKLMTDRRISQETVNRLKIRQERNAVAFCYYLNDEVVNIKYRGTTEKKFYQTKNGMHIVYNYDNVKAYMEASGDFRVVITEGEFDVAAFDTQGIHFAVSLDSGAVGANDTSIGGKLECITAASYLFELADTIYIATDNDENGRRTAEELRRRFPPEKTRVVNWGKYKDANEAHLYAEDLNSFLKSAKEFKMEGVFSADDVLDKLWDNYRNGLPKGTTTHMPSVDKVWKWRMGEVTLVTGYMNEGKTTLLNFLIMLKAAFENWSAAIFSPENFPPEEFYEDVIHMYKGRTTDVDFQGRQSEKDFEDGIRFARDHFFLVYPEERVTIDELFNRFDYLIRKRGVKVCVLDPFNQIEHLYDKGETIDMYVSRFMTRLKRFAVTRQVAMILVAHQNKPQEKDTNGNYPRPSAYNIKNGGTFADKADNVLAFWRPYRATDDSNPEVMVISDKIKKKKLVAPTGETKIYYDWKSNQYRDQDLEGRSPLENKLAHESFEEKAMPELWS